MAECSIPNKLRSSRSQMFFKIGVLKNFANFTGEYLYWSLFLIFNSIHIYSQKNIYIYIYKIKLQNTTKILLRI